MAQRLVMSFEGVCLMRSLPTGLCVANHSPQFQNICSYIFIQAGIWRLRNLAPWPDQPAKGVTHKQRVMNESTQSSKVELDSAPMTHYQPERTTEDRPPYNSSQVLTLVRFPSLQSAKLVSESGSCAGAFSCQVFLKIVDGLIEIVNDFLLHSMRELCFPEC